MPKDEKIFTFRVSSVLLDYLKERAERNKRSIAKELEFIVEELYFQEHRALSDSLDELVNVLDTQNINTANLKKTLEHTIQKATPDDPLLKATIKVFKALNEVHNSI